MPEEKLVPGSHKRCELEHNVGNKGNQKKKKNIGKKGVNFGNLYFSNNDFNIKAGILVMSTSGFACVRGSPDARIFWIRARWDHFYLRSR